MHKSETVLINGRQIEAWNAKDTVRQTVFINGRQIEAWNARDTVRQIVSK